MREALRYLENAKEILKKVPLEDETYTDIKYVQEACGTAYLAILKAVDEYLVRRGVGGVALHIAGYYRGLLEDVAMVKDAFRAAKVFIDKLK